MWKILIFIFVFLMSTISFQFCKRNSFDKKIETIDYKSISIIKKSGKEFLDIGKVEKVIKLETTPNSLIGEISKVLIDGNTNDIYVLDSYISKKLFRFDKKGKFINSYGRRGQGPGEYLDIMNFSIDTESNIILLSPVKLLKFEKNGRFIKERKINFWAGDMTSFLEKLYIYVYKYKFKPTVKYSVLILDLDFNEIGGLSPYDTRLAKYVFGGTNNIAKSTRNVYFIDNYDLRLQIYNPENDKITRLEIPNSNKKLDATWEKSQFVESDRTEIKNKLQFFDSIYEFNDILFLRERCKEKGIINNWLLNLEKKTAIIFNVQEEFLAGKYYILGFYGSYVRGLLGVIADDVAFRSFKSVFGKDYPFLKDIEYALEDNPILLFIKFEDKIWE